MRKIFTFLIFIILFNFPVYAEDNVLIGFTGEYALTNDDTPVSVIVLFEHESAAMQVHEAEAEGFFLPFSVASQSARDDHALFRAELSALFSISPMSRNSSGAPYSIDWEYHHALNGVSVTMPSNKVAELANFQSVRYVFPDEEIKPPQQSVVPMNTPQGMAIGRASMRINEIHNMGYRGEGQVIAVIDTGIYYNHEAFQGAFLTLEEMQARNPNVTSAQAIDGIFYGRNFHTSDGTAPNDPMESLNRTVHGTHVSGTVAGRNAGGSRAVLGVAPEAKIFVYRVMGSSAGSSSVFAAAIDRVALDKPDVVNLSLGVERSNDPIHILSLALNNAALTNPHIVFVTAAGNNGGDTGSISAPGAAAAAITVGDAIVTQSGNTFLKSVGNSATRGPVRRSYEIKPDVMAHGTNVYSTLPPWAAYYGNRTGTSMATPHVSGAAALMKQYNPEWTAEEIKSRLMNTAVPVSAANIFITGAGYCDIYAALHADTVVSVINDRAALHADAFALSDFADTRTGSFSFGGTSFVRHNIFRTLAATIYNKSPFPRTYEISYFYTSNPGGARLIFPKSVYVPANSEADFFVDFSLKAALSGIGFFEGIMHVSYENEIVASLPFAYEAGNALTPRLGDTDGNGRVTSADATLLARHLANHDIEMNFRAADINCDGEISPADLTRLARALVGVYDTLCISGGCNRCAAYN